jgi:hypothetical protein
MIVNPNKPLISAAGEPEYMKIIRKNKSYDSLQTLGVRSYTPSVQLLS